MASFAAVEDFGDGDEAAMVGNRQAGNGTSPEEKIDGRTAKFVIQTLSGLSTNCVVLFSFLFFALKK